jgi:hypothetical protein
MGAKRPTPIPGWRDELPTDVITLAEKVAAEIRIPVDSLFDGKADQASRSGRQKVMALLRGGGGYTLQRIASLFRVHHSLVVYAVKKYTPDDVKPPAAGSIHRSNLRESSGVFVGHPRP